MMVDEEYGAEVDVDLDADFEEPVDVAAAKKTAADSLPPKGTYRTEPETVQVERKKTDADGNPIERPLYKVSGFMNHRREEGVRQLFRFTFSPKRQDKDDKPGSPDWASALYGKLVAAMIDATGEEPKTVADIKRYLTSLPVDLTTFRGDDSLVVNGFKAVKE